MRNLNSGVEKISRVLWNVLRISKPENVMGIKHEKKRYDTLLKMRWIQRSLYKLSSYFCWKEEKSSAYLICRWVARDSKWNNIKMLLTGVTINDYKGLHHYKFIIWRDICHSKKMFWIEKEFEKRFFHTTCEILVKDKQFKHTKKITKKINVKIEKQHRFTNKSAKK